MKRIALIGNPNCGKSTLFNRITGLNQKTSNLPGTTVEAYVGKTRHDGQEIEWVDLPGIYSLFTNSEYEHVVNTHLLANGVPKLDGILFVFDSSNLRRNLLLYSQIAELGIPSAGILTMGDTAKRREIDINQKRLSEVLGIPIISLNPRSDKTVKPIWILINELQKGHMLTENEGFKERLTRFTEGTIDRGISEETLRRYADIDKVIKEVIPQKKRLKAFNTLKIDRILTHPVYGLTAFLLVMLILFQGVFSLAETPMSVIEHFFAYLRDVSSKWFQNEYLSSFLSNGLLSGLEGVVIFVPQIFILFFLIGILEDSGYMVRASFISDRIMRKVGLNGRSIIPLVGGFACAIPSIMATRTIRDKKERLATMLIVPLMSCSARLPVYVLLISLAVPKGTFWGPLPTQTTLMTAAYFAGIALAIVLAWIFKILHRTPETSEFVLELPTYQAPRFQTVMQGAWIKCKAFLNEAGKVIVVISIVLWALSSFGPGEAFQNADRRAELECASINSPEEKEMAIANLQNTYRLEESYAGRMGKFIEPAIQPLGYDWKTGIALISSFAAREVFVGTMSTLFTQDDGNEDVVGIRKKMQLVKDPATGEPLYGAPYAISLMLFYAFALQCMSTMAVLKKETGSWIWPISMFIIYGIASYISAFIAYNLLS